MCVVSKRAAKMSMGQTVPEIPGKIQTRQKDESAKGIVGCASHQVANSVRL